MKFVQTTIKVKDMEASLKFYKEIVGLKEAQRISMEKIEMVFLGEGETKVELIHYKDSKEVQYSEDISIGFSVENLDETMTFVQEKGIKIHSGPIQPNPSTRFFYVLDPNGLKVQFIEIK